MNTITSRERLSPDGKYKLVITPIDNGAGSWFYLDVGVYRVSDGHLIGSTSRNYSNDHILHFVTQDGKDYLVISENYHGGYGVMDLETGEKAVYTPSKDPKEKHQQFWCWAGGVSHDPEKKELVIAGCYWAAPYERITFDFSNPMSPPYRIIKIEDEEYEDDDEEEDSE